MMFVSFIGPALWLCGITRGFAANVFKVPEASRGLTAEEKYKEAVCAHVCALLALVSYTLFVFGAKYLVSGSFRQRVYGLAYTKFCIAVAPALLTKALFTLRAWPGYLFPMALVEAIGVSFLCAAVPGLIVMLCFSALHMIVAQSLCLSSEQWLSKRGWSKYIQKAQIRWVRVGAFRRWNREGLPIPRAQELSDCDFVVGGSSPGRLIISHVWRAPEHPDPHGHGLRELVDEFDRLEVMDEELVFYDYCSLFQDDKQDPDWGRFKHKPPQGHPRTYLRTREQCALFENAVAQMHLLYSRGFGRVLVMPQAPDNVRPYADRGWCFFELMACTSSGRLANADNCDVAAVLEETQMPMGFFRYMRQFRSKHFTGRGDGKLVFRLYMRMWLERVISQAALVLLVLVLLCCTVNSDVLDWGPETNGFGMLVLVSIALAVAMLVA